MQLALQDLGALVVGADRTRPVTRSRLQLHQRAVSKLLKRLQSHADPAIFNGFLEVAQVSPPGHQLVAEFDTLAAQLIALHEDPVVVHPRQQIAAILLDRRSSMLEHRVLVAGRERLQR